MPQIRPLADNVHSKDRFTYLLTYFAGNRRMMTSVSLRPSMDPATTTRKLRCRIKYSSSRLLCATTIHHSELSTSRSTWSTARDASWASTTSPTRIRMRISTASSWNTSGGIPATDRSNKLSTDIERVQKRCLKIILLVLCE